VCRKRRAPFSEQDDIKKIAAGLLFMAPRTLNAAASNRRNFAFDLGNGYAAPRRRKNTFRAVASDPFCCDARVSLCEGDMFHSKPRSFCSAGILPA
jgi:hypothetical protein